jgi:hypothetical protein
MGQYKFTRMSEQSSDCRRPLASRTSKRRSANSGSFHLTINCSIAMPDVKRGPTATMAPCWQPGTEQTSSGFTCVRPFELPLESNSASLAAQNYPSRPAPYFDLRLRTLSGRDIVVEAHPIDLVQDIKFLLSDLEGIPPGHQRLILGGAELEDDRSLLCYGIRADVVVHLVVRPAVSLGNMARAKSNASFRPVLPRSEAIRKPDGRTCNFSARFAATAETLQ